MKWSALTKEQRERLVLKAVLALIALAAIHFYGIAPLLERIRTAGDDLEALGARLERVTRLARRREPLQTGLEDNVRTLRSLFTEYLPPADNPFLWATEHVYRLAREYGVSIESITEVRQPLPAWVKRRDAPGDTGADAGESGKPPDAGGPPGPPNEEGRRFAPYAVQIRARCDYPDFLRMIRAMERDNPYVSMTGVSVTADDTRPRQQSIRLTVEWPRHVGPLDPAMQEVLPPTPEGEGGGA